MNIIIKSAFKSIAVVFVAMMMVVFSMITLLPVFGQETRTTTNIITDLVKTTAEKIKNRASEVANNTTGIISPSEAKNILNQLGDAARKTALGGADVLSNITGEIKEGLK